MGMDAPDLGRGIFGYRKSVVDQIIADRDIMLRQAEGRVRAAESKVAELEGELASIRDRNSRIEEQLERLRGQIDRLAPAEDHVPSFPDPYAEHTAGVETAGGEGQPHPPEPTDVPPPEPGDLGGLVTARHGPRDLTAAEGTPAPEYAAWGQASYHETGEDEPTASEPAEGRVGYELEPLEDVRAPQEEPMEQPPFDHARPSEEGHSVPAGPADAGRAASDQEWERFLAAGEEEQLPTWTVEEPAPAGGGGSEDATFREAFGTEPEAFGTEPEAGFAAPPEPAIEEYPEAAPGPEAEPVPPPQALGFDLPMPSAPAAEESSASRIVSEEIGGILQAAEESAARIVERARATSQHQIAQSNQLWRDVQAEVAKFTSWREEIEPIIQTVQHKVDDVRARIEEVPDLIRQALAPMADAISSIDADLADLAATATPPRPAPPTAMAGPEDHEAWEPEPDE